MEEDPSGKDVPGPTEKINPEITTEIGNFP